MIVIMDPKIAFPHLDFELVRAFKVAADLGAKEIEFASTGETLIDGKPVDELRSVLSDREQRMSVVYAIGAAGHIKIGFTANIRKRVSQMQNGNPYLLEVLAVWAGGTKEEKALHRALDAHRGSGEWFSDNKVVRAAISKASGIAI